jgi:hypothetical protein
VAPLKTKGDLAELIVAADLVKRGFRVAFPFGEDCDWDLLFWRPPGTELERVQVKYSRSDGAVLPVRCQSFSLTNGRVRASSGTAGTCSISGSSRRGAGRCQALGAGPMPASWRAAYAAAARSFTQ